MKEFINRHYKDYAGDLFSVFIYRNLLLCQPGGYCGFMSPFVWMFIKTYQNLREYIIQNATITTLIQMEYSAFEEATVPICSFVLKNSSAGEKGLYFRLSEFKGGMEVQRQKVLEAIADPDCGYFYEAQQSNFSKIPGSPVAYWVSEKLFSAFATYPSLNDYAIPRQGLITGDNDRFLRFWFEVSRIKTSFEKQVGRKWYPINKGGEYRRWYGNQEYVVNWESNGKEISNFVDDRGKLRSRPQNLIYNFQKSISWSLVTSGGFSVRFYPETFMFNVAGISCFPNHHLYYLLGLLNSNLVENITRILNPTLNMNAGDVGKIPVKIDTKKESMVENIVLIAINTSSNDWYSYETSWDFKRHPLI